MLAGMFGIIGGLVVLAFLMMLFVALCFKRCPPDKLLLIFGYPNTRRAPKIIHGGVAFVLPVIQDSVYLDLTPIQVDVNLRGTLSQQDISVDSPSRFTVSISEKEDIAQCATYHLLGLDAKEISKLAHDIIIREMRRIIPQIKKTDIHDTQKLQDQIYEKIEPKLENIGLKLINAHVKVSKLTT